MHCVALDMWDPQYVQHLRADDAAPRQFAGIAGEALRIGEQGCGGNQALAAKQLEEGPVVQTQYLVPMTIGFQHFCVVTQLQVGGVVYDSHASS